VTGRPPQYAQERSFPRVQYPSHLRPYLVVSGEICEVVDCSERGLRYGSSLDPRPVGSLVNARLCLRSGLELAIRGRVIRIQGDEVALYLEASHAIPPEVITAEVAALREA
jgi:hypothetical protein